MFYIRIRPYSDPADKGEVFYRTESLELANRLVTELTELTPFDVIPPQFTIIPAATPAITSRMLWDKTIDDIGIAVQAYRNSHYLDHNDTRIQKCLPRSIDPEAPPVIDDDNPTSIRRLYDLAERWEGPIKDAIPAEDAAKDPVALLEWMANRVDAYANAVKRETSVFPRNFDVCHKTHPTDPVPNILIRAIRPHEKQWPLPEPWRLLETLLVTQGDRERWSDLQERFVEVNEIAAYTDNTLRETEQLEHEQKQ